MLTHRLPHKDNTNRKFTFLIMLCLIPLMSGCLKNPFPPILKTEQIEIVDGITIISGGIISDDGGTDIFQKGICVSTSNTPTVKDSYTIDGTGNSDFKTILYVEPEITYYIRAYAINGAGIGYGDILTVKLDPLPFTYATIIDFGDITGTEAFMRARVESNQTVTARGACWSTSNNPTINDYKLESGSGTGIFETTLTGLNPGTTYYTRAYAISGSETYYSSNFEFTTKDYPQLTTHEIRNSGTFIISTGGDILSTGIIYNAGVCWSTESSPTIDDNKTEDNLIYSTFYSDPHDLLPGTTYYLRSYATNLVGTGYGNEIVFTMPEATVYDIDGNPYSLVTIGTQTWLTENLNTTKYSNGDEILHISDGNEWQNTITGAWCFFGNLSEFEVPYGRLYNWYSITDSRNVCPEGWHVPSDTEWQTLFTYLGGIENAGNALKETGAAHWATGNDYANNSSGFTALPGGGQSALQGYSYPAQSLGMFWSTTMIDEQNAYGYYLFDSYQAVNQQSYLKQTGLSVRCIKDE